MQCSEINRLLPEYAVGALDGQVELQVLAHVDACAACRAELDALVTVGEMLEPVEMLSPPRDLWPEIAAALQPQAKQKPGWRLHTRPALALAAAVLLVALVFMLPILQAPMPIPPVVDTLPFVAGVDDVEYTEAQLAAAWNQPFADEASLALAMAVLQPQPNGEAMQ